MQSEILQTSNSASSPPRPPTTLPSSRSSGRRICFLAYLFICFFVSLSACTQTPTATIEEVSFTVYVDSSTEPLMEELVEVYTVDRAHVTIRLEKAPNSEKGLEALLKGEADLVSVSWLPEGVKIRETLWAHAFARDSIVVITNLTNPVSGLTLLQLRSIFQGHIFHWVELGGPSIDIVPVSREDGAGTRLSFDSLVLGGRGVASTSVVMPSNEAVAQFVAITPGAIGYVSSAWLVPSVNLLAIEGVTPSRLSVQDGRYVLARPFYLVAFAQPSGGLARFIDWVREGVGKDIVERNYALAP